MIKINTALISEVKRRLPKNVNPPITLEFLLKQKAVEKIEHKDYNNTNNLINKKIIENFIRNNSSKPFSSLKRKINMRQSIITTRKKILNLNNISKKYSTPFQIQHIKMDYQKQLINKKINKKFPNIEINGNKKNIFDLFKKSKSCSSFFDTKMNNSTIKVGKFTYRPDIKYRTIILNNNQNNLFYNEKIFRSINNDDLNNNYNSTGHIKKFKPNCYYNKLHLDKFNKNLFHHSSNKTHLKK